MFKAIQAVKFDSQMVLNCQRKLKQFVKGHSVILRLKLSHSEISQNELDDGLASLVSERPFQGHNQSVGVPIIA